MILQLCNEGRRTDAIEEFKMYKLIPTVHPFPFKSNLYLQHSNTSVNKPKHIT